MNGRLYYLIALALVFGLATCASADLIGHWKFDEGVGTTAMDSSGHGHDGTFEGDPEWVAGRFGGGLDFDGLGGERVVLGTLDLQAEALSIALWLKADNLDTPGNDPRMISKANGGANNDHWWMISSGRISGNKYLRFRLKTTDGQQTGELKAGTLEVDEWVHAVAWWDGTSMRIYKNGVEAGDLAKGGDAVATDASVHAAIGNQPVGAENRPFDGILDDVRIYNEALSEDEIAAIMEGVGAESPLAVGPNPKDGATLGTTWVKLEWTPGSWAVSHDLYIGTNYDDVNDSAEGTFIGNIADNSQIIGFQNLPFPDGLQPGTTYYWRVDEVNPANADSPWKGAVWSFWVAPKTAYNPLPADTMKFVDTDTELNWTPGWNGIMYTAYLGTDPDEVANATEGGMMLAKPTFDPGALELDTTYYWRIDSFDGTAWHTGDVWSFTTAGPGGGLRGEYAHYAGGVPSPPESAVQNVVLTRIDPGIDFQWGNGSPEPNVVDADNFAVLWTGELEVPLTGRYTFWATTDDGVLLWVNGVEIASAWRTQEAVEQSGQIELVAGEIAFVQMLYFATTGNAMAELRWQHEMIPKQIIPAAAFSPPMRGSRPAPPNGAEDVSQTPELHWSGGQNAAQHDVYFGDDADAVTGADTTTAGIYRGRQDAVSFAPGVLEWNKTYYWRIDEVNDAEADSPWVGSVWSFTTADFLIVDDFESYDDAGHRIYQTWIDGEGNATGSYVGYPVANGGTFGETGTVHSGGQSMPLEYNDTVAPFYSETERTLAAPENLTVNGVDTLTLFVWGDAGNDPEPLYVALEDSAGRVGVAVHPDPAIVTNAGWTEWRIPLSEFSDAGVNVAAVKKMYIGLGDRNAPTPGGAGLIFIDDIRVTRSAPIE